MSSAILSEVAKLTQMVTLLTEKLSLSQEELVLNAQKNIELRQKCDETEKQLLESQSSVAALSEKVQLLLSQNDELTTQVAGLSQLLEVNSAALEESKEQLLQMKSEQSRGRFFGSTSGLSEEPALSPSAKTYINSNLERVKSPLSVSENAVPLLNRRSKSLYSISLSSQARKPLSPGSSGISSPISANWNLPAWSRTSVSVDTDVDAVVVEDGVVSVSSTPSSPDSSTKRTSFDINEPVTTRSPIIIQPFDANKSSQSIAQSPKTPHSIVADSVSSTGDSLIGPVLIPLSHAASPSNSLLSSMKRVNVESDNLSLPIIAESSAAESSSPTHRSLKSTGSLFGGASFRTAALSPKQSYVKNPNVNSDSEALASLSIDVAAASLLLKQEAVQLLDMRESISDLRNNVENQPNGRQNSDVNVSLRSVLLEVDSTLNSIFAARQIAAEKGAGVDAISNALRDAQVSLPTFTTDSVDSHFDVDVTNVASSSAVSLEPDTAPSDFKVPSRLEIPVRPFSDRVPFSPQPSKTPLKGLTPAERGREALSAWRTSRNSILVYAGLPGSTPAANVDRILSSPTSNTSKSGFMRPILFTPKGSVGERSFSDQFSSSIGSNSGYISSSYGGSQKFSSRSTSKSSGGFVGINRYLHTTIPLAIDATSSQSSVLMRGPGAFSK